MEEEGYQGKWNERKEWLLGTQNGKRNESRLDCLDNYFHHHLLHHLLLRVAGNGKSWGLLAGASQGETGSRELESEVPSVAYSTEAVAAC